jgi:hypothetical protein
MFLSVPAFHRSTVAINDLAMFPSATNKLRRDMDEKKPGMNREGSE